MGLEIVPCSISDAKAFVHQHHRHHKPPVSALFAVAVASAGDVVGVAIVGRPVARGLQDSFTAEVTRVATDGAGLAPADHIHAGVRGGSITSRRGLESRWKSERTNMGLPVAPPRGQASNARQAPLARTIR